MEVQSPNSSLHAIVFESEGVWLAQILEYDLVGVADRLEDLPRCLELQLKALFEVSASRGVSPFSGHKPAPRKYWEMFESAGAKSLVIEPPKSPAPVILAFAA